MRITEAYQLFADGQRLAWRSLRAGTLGRAGLRPAVGAFVRPLTAASRYPEYDVFFEMLRGAIDLDDPRTWVLDVSSPKLFSLLLASRTRANVVATDIWQPAIDEAAALRGGLSEDASARLHLGIADGREPIPAALQPPGGKFAGAYSMSVIEHVEPDPGGDRIALRRLAEAVVAGGTVVVSIPVAPEARSIYLREEMYGRTSTDERGAFFYRLYDVAALRELCAAVADVLALERCVISAWPDHPLVNLATRFPTAIGFVGASFPLISNRFEITSSPQIPDQLTVTGDAILELRRKPDA